MFEKIAIVNYGICNVASVQRSLLQLGVNAIISSDPVQIQQADKLILPGIGNFGQGMQNLASLGLLPALQQAACVAKKPLLGICLGMQLMAAFSEEAPGIAGLGWIKETIIRFDMANTQRFKVPHIGWNTLEATRANPLLAGIPPEAEFYFTHSYHYGSANAPWSLALTEYESPFTSVVGQDHFLGVQFHPEKSGEAGLQLFKNFLSL